MDSPENASILIVDDDPEYRSGLKRLLRIACGIMPQEILEAESGSEAETILQNTSPFCVLLDNMMPGGKGLDWLEKLLNSCRSTEIILLSGDDSKEIREDAIQKGASACIAKTMMSPGRLKMHISPIIEAALPGQQPFNGQTS